MYACESRALRQDSYKHRSETISAPIVGHDKSKLSCFRTGVAYEASFRNERRELTCSPMYLGNDCNVSAWLDHRELVQQALRDLIGRAVKSKPKGRARQRCEEFSKWTQI